MAHRIPKEKLVPAWHGVSFQRRVDEPTIELLEALKDSISDALPMMSDDTLRCLAHIWLRTVDSIIILNRTV